MLANARLMWIIMSAAERWRFLVVMLLSMVMAVFELLSVAGIFPFLSLLASPDLADTNPWFDRFARLFGLDGFREVAIGVGLAVFTMVMVGMAVRAAVTYIQLRFGLNLGYKLAARLLRNQLGQDYAYHLMRSTATTSQSILSEVDLVVRSNIIPSITLMSNLMVLTLVGGFLIYASPAIAFAALVLLVGVYGSVFMLLRRRMAQVGDRRLVVNGQRFKAIGEVMESLKDIRVMGLERSSMRRFIAPASEMARLQTAALVMERLPRFAVEGVVYGGFVAMVLLLVVLRDGDIEDILPVLGLLALSATKLFPALQQIYQSVTAIRVSTAALSRLHGDIQASDLPALPPRAETRLPLTRSLEFQEVCFRYPGAQRDIFDGLSMTIKARSTVGFVGGTGAGKTTVIDIVMGLLVPFKGQVLVDGVPLSADNVRSWQRNIGYVPQSIFLLDDTIAANIAFGVDPADVDMGQVERAARLANLHEFVANDLPDGYHTIVGDRGKRLSGGQRQRIGIARALYDDPDVLVLDEATSALDNVTERAVIDAVRTIGASKTVLMIAHRLTTVRDCDTIYVMEQGRILDQGRYRELHERNSVFRNMVDT